MSPGLDFLHRFVPGATGQPPLTLLLLHGTGGDEEDLLPLGRNLYPDAALLSPRGRVVENGMPRFFRRLAEGVFDLENLFAETAALGAFVGRAASAYGFDPGKVVAVGFSNGANIAASMLLRDPGRLAGAVLLRPMLPFRPDVRPDLHGRPVLIRSGRHDPLVRPDAPDQLAALLRECGAEVELDWSQAGHQLALEDIQGAAAWLKRVRPPSPPGLGSGT